MTQTANDDPTLAGSEPIAVRVKKYAICDFCAFPGPEVYEFEVNGRNLLLWGENGSGKSSFYKALQTLLDPQNETPFSHFKNIFSSTPDPFEEGIVLIELDNSTPNEFCWSHGEERPSDYSFRQMATRATFLDYRSLLRAQADDEESFDLFPLLMNVLLRYVPNPATGQTFYEDWQQLCNLQPDASTQTTKRAMKTKHMPSPEEQLTSAAQTFRGQLEGFLSELETTI
jgi:energy-coupling factor transporter ATP-binding protein EcfA2